MTPHGHFHWNELLTRDVAAAKKLYADALGWSYEEMPMPDGSTYILCKAGKEMAAGMMDTTSMEYLDGMPNHWMAYISVDDVDARLEKAKAAGATVTQEPFDVQGVGRIAMVQQPDGAMIGWMSPSDEPM